MNRTRILVTCLPLLLLVIGCGAEPAPAPPIDATMRSAIEQEDAAVFEAESQQ